MTKGLIDAKLVHCKPLPRHVRRIIHDTEQCHYQREEYMTSAERNDRYRQLRGMPDLVKYSDCNAIGLLVFVVAWTRPADDNELNRNGKGMTTANRKAAGGPPHLPLGGNSQKLPSESNSIQFDDNDIADHWKNKELGIEKISI